jgi:hypothetical protein
MDGDSDGAVCLDTPHRISSAGYYKVYGPAGRGRRHRPWLPQLAAGAGKSMTGQDSSMQPARGDSTANARCGRAEDKSRLADKLNIISRT